MFICDFIACHPSVPQHAVTKEKNYLYSNLRAFTFKAIRSFAGMKVLLSLIQIDLELYMYLFSYFLMKEIKSDGLFWGVDFG
ncbi:hypothetical protein C1N51_10845 [Vibrio campbellii]|nr:hypothetical protein C1N51_10845 [Vibrio campbellii]